MLFMFFNNIQYTVYINLNYLLMSIFVASYLKAFFEKQYLYSFHFDKKKFTLHIV